MVAGIWGWFRVLCAKVQPPEIPAIHVPPRFLTTGQILKFFFLTKKKKTHGRYVVSAFPGDALILLCARNQLVP